METAGRRAKTDQNLGLGDTSNTYEVYLWPSNVQGHFKVIRSTCLKMACNSKTAGRRAKQVQFDTRGQLLYNIGWFDVVGFKVNFGTFGALVLKWPVSRKRLCLEKGWSETEWNLGITNASYTYIGYFDLAGFKVTLGLFGERVSKWPVSRKGLVVERNGLKFGNPEQNVYIYRVIWRCRGRGQFGVIQCTCLKMAGIKNGWS